MKTNCVKNYFLITLFTFLLLFTGILNKKLNKPVINISKQQSAINFNDYFLLFIGASNIRLLSDLFWITTLIESDLEQYKNKDLNSWMFLRFKTITTLDPLFLMAYQFGGLYLNIVKDDVLGSNSIFKKGLEKYPKDYNLNYNYAYLNAFEIGNINEAIRSYEIIRNHPKAPKFLPDLINRLKFSLTNDLELALKLNIDRYHNLKASFLKNKIAKNIYAIKAEIDLKCLNNNENKCDKKDFFGNEYIFKDGKYQAKLKYFPYRLDKKN